MWNRILDNGFSRIGFSIMDSQELDSHGLDSQESDSRSSKSWESRFGSLGNPSIEKISIKIKFGSQQVMNFGIQKRRGTQLRAGWSNFHAVSSVLRSIYAKSLDLEIPGNYIIRGTIKKRMTVGEAISGCTSQGGGRFF